ncbi:Quinone oxidoreductase PIG3 [Camellia lanceoleosa]|uniref:Quinone oxidoreductase PIG3 n=1 Tax=Camellia lanceoleosa TaxID=1840588 RepID=A0ACC0FGU7_9ERIC|nr:Quinone oxidoreductase PIG3 [Camellia lanceoleosa]
MKAVVITNLGGPKVLRIQEVENPEFKDNKVFIRVEATALSRADTIRRKGLYTPLKGSSSFLSLKCLQWEESSFSADGGGSTTKTSTLPD